MCGDALVCRTEDDWLVSEALVGDVNHDGGLELVLLVWKRGSYGPYRPFWVERDEIGFSQHVFILKLDDKGRLSPIWMSSALGMEVTSAHLDGAARLVLTERDGSLTSWEWMSWGLGLTEEGEVAAPADVTPGESGATLTLLAVGDCIIHEDVLRSAYDDGRYDFSAVFARVAPWISSFDLAVVTQESPLVGDGNVAGYPLFATPQTLGDALADAGFDVVASATNHALDRGVGGLEDTITFWDTQHPEVTVLGLHEIPEDPMVSFVTCKDFTLAFVNATYGLNGQALPDGEDWRIDVLGDGNGFEQAVADAERVADITVCVLHIGEEYADAPTEEQRQVEERIVAAGADVVICSHAHVVQGVELMAGAGEHEAVVFHGLGNFVSGQLDPRCVLGGAACVTVGRDTDGEAFVEAYSLEGTVCHFTGSSTEVYRLEAYDAQTAEGHLLNTHGEGEEKVTPEKLRAQLETARG